MKKFLLLPLEERSSGRVYCVYCSELVRQRNIKKHQKRIGKEFSEYKEHMKCQLCGYNTFGCCLDFHHINPKEKERRITAKMWKYQKEEIHKEFRKCILVCKNCHSELHYWMRNDLKRYWNIIGDVTDES